MRYDVNLYGNFSLHRNGNLTSHLNTLTTFHQFYGDSCALVAFHSFASSDRMNGLIPAVLIAVAISFERNPYAAPVSDLQCPNLNIVSRSQWEARNPMRERKLYVPVNHIVISHTVTKFCKSETQCRRSVQFIQDMHLDDRGWWDIAYNFLIGGDGNVYEGRGWSNTGSFAVNYNTIALGISFIGNFNKDKPTKAMLNAALNLINCGVEKGYISPMREIHGHRDVACTESPGDNLYAEIRRWENFRGGRLPNYYCKKLDVPTANKDIVNDR